MRKLLARFLQAIACGKLTYISIAIVAFSWSQFYCAKIIARSEMRLSREPGLQLADNKAEQFWRQLTSKANCDLSYKQFGQKAARTAIVVANIARLKVKLEYCVRW